MTEYLLKFLKSTKELRSELKSQAKTPETLLKNKSELGKRIESKLAEANEFYKDKTLKIDSNLLIKREPISKTSSSRKLGWVDTHRKNFDKKILSISKFSIKKPVQEKIPAPKQSSPYKERLPVVFVKKQAIKSCSLKINKLYKANKIDVVRKIYRKHSQLS